LLHRLPTPLAGALLALVAVLSWGAMFRIGAEALTRMDAAHLTLIRYGLAAPVFVGLLLLVEGRASLRLEGRGAQAWLFGTLGFAGFNLLTFAALRHTEPQRAALVVALMPMITILAVWLRSHVRPSGAVLAAVLAAFVGVGVVITDGDPAALTDGQMGIGELMTLAGGTAWVAYSLGAASFPTWSPLRYTALTAALGSLSIAALTIAGDLTGVLVPPSAGDVAAVAPEIAYVVLFGAVAAVLAWNNAMRRLGPSRTVLFMNLVPITAFTIEIARGLRPGIVELAGAGLTVAALVAANVAQARDTGERAPTRAERRAARRRAAAEARWVADTVRVRA
jgi:drug/metabolite transporter (DMT)-like permease